MSQVVVTLVTWLSVIPDAAKSAIYILCELVVGTVVISPLLFRGTPEPRTGAIEEPRGAGPRGLSQ